VRTDYFVDALPDGSLQQGEKDSPFSVGSTSDFGQRVMSDVETPNYHAISRQGGIVNSPMESTLEEYGDGPCYLDHSRTYDTVASTGEIFKKGVAFKGNWPASTMVRYDDGLQWFTVPVDTIDITAVQDIAVTQAHANISLAETSGLVTLGEGKETIAFLTSSFKRALKILKAVKTLNFRYLRKQISRKELEARYMEYRYALRPLIADVASTTAAFKKEVQDITDRLTFRGFHSQSVASVPVVDTIVWGEGTYCFDTVKQGKRTVSARAGVLAQIQYASELAVWGLDRPLEAGWDLIPFSFVADWFFNIGDTIASFTPNVGINKLASWVTTREESVYTWKVVNGRTIGAIAPYTDVHTSLVGGEMYRRVTKVTRVPNPQLSLIPRFRLNLDAFKLLDLSIMARSLKGDFKRLRI
jgi:hypothetical protein